MPRTVAGWPHRGTLPAEGSLLAVTPDCVRVVEFSREGGNVQLTLQNCSDTPMEACVTLPEENRHIVLPPWRFTEVRREG